MSEEPDEVDLATPDLAAEKREAFEDLFPGVLADGVLDATRLGELLDFPVAQAADARERFGLMWAGKQEAVRSLLKPSRGALVPDLENSIDFDAAQNVFIEGDNLEVLKLLQKAYNDKVKLIYIDPPYNTGNDFVYNDDFSDGLRGYLEYTGQLDDDGKLTSTNADTAGRKHSRWLSMMYPRLVLARNLLTQDGVIFVSIDDNEGSHLAGLMDEIFGAENRLAHVTVVSNLKGRSDDKFFATAHSYLFVYRRSDRFVPLGVPLADEYISSYGEEDSGGRYRPLPLRKSGSNSLRTDRPNMFFPFYVDPSSLTVSTVASEQHSIEVWPRFPDGRDGRWRWGPATGEERCSELIARQVGPEKRWDVFHKDYLNRGGGEERRSVPKTVWTGPEFDNGNGTAQVKDVFGDRVFDGPKPTGLIQQILEMATVGGDLVLDFFAGSGTTAHAVALQNAEDGGHRRTISVNIPEPTAEVSAAHKAGFETVSDITLARLEWVISNVDGAAAQGLRVLRLSPSTFRTYQAAEGELDLSEGTLIDAEPFVEDVAAEVLLKEGVMLDSSWERHQVGGDDAVVADGVAVVVSLDISDEVVDDALALEPRVLVFLEDGFAGKDAVKANAFTRARNAGITMKTV